MPTQNAWLRLTYVFRCPVQLRFGLEFCSPPLSNVGRPFAFELFRGWRQCSGCGIGCVGCMRGRSSACSCISIGQHRARGLPGSHVANHRKSDSISLEKLHRITANASATVTAEVRIDDDAADPVEAAIGALRFQRSRPKEYARRSKENAANFVNSDVDVHIAESEA